MTEQRLLCFASGRPGDWQGICVNFDIAVHGRSFEEVQSLLDEAVRTYIEDASREDEATRDRLLKRRAPFLTRLRLVTGFMWHALRDRDGERSEHSYHVPCHA